MRVRHARTSGESTWRGVRRGVKRALAQLKDAAECKAPLLRNAYEWAWLNFAARHCPANVPEQLAHDEKAGLFAMAASLRRAVVALP